MATTTQLYDQVKKTLQVEVNPTTGNIFYTIADHETLAMHMRIWKDVTNKTETAIGFRVRLTKNPAGPAILNLQEHIMGLFPGVPWMGKSSSHMSLAGVFKVGLSQYEGLAIMEQLEKEGMYKKVWDHLQKTFPTFEYKLNEETFSEFMKEVISEELGIGKPHEGPTASVFSFGEAKAAKNEAQTNQDSSPTLHPMTNHSDDPTASANTDSHVLPGGGLLGKLKEKVGKKAPGEGGSLTGVDYVNIAADAAEMAAAANGQPFDKKAFISEGLSKLEAPKDNSVLNYTVQAEASQNFKVSDAVAIVYQDTEGQKDKLRQFLTDTGLLGFVGFESLHKYLTGNGVFTEEEAAQVMLHMELGDDMELDEIAADFGYELDPDGFYYVLSASKFADYINEHLYTNIIL